MGCRQSVATSHDGDLVARRHSKCEDIEPNERIPILDVLKQKRREKRLSRIIQQKKHLEPADDSDTQKDVSEETSGGSEADVTCDVGSHVPAPEPVKVVEEVPEVPVAGSEFTPLETIQEQYDNNDEEASEDEQNKHAAAGKEGKSKAEISRKKQKNRRQSNKDFMLQKLKDREQQHRAKIQAHQDAVQEVLQSTESEQSLLEKAKQDNEKAKQQAEKERLLRQAELDPIHKLHEQQDAERLQRIAAAKLMAPRKLTQSEAENCSSWYNRLCQPNRDKMLDLVSKMDPEQDGITLEHVICMPWPNHGMYVDVKQLNAWICHGEDYA